MKSPPALAVELLNDWDAIFQALRHSELPLTNNAAALGDRSQDQPRRPHRLAGLRPAGQRHRHLPATRSLSLSNCLRNRWNDSSNGSFFSNDVVASIDWK